MKRYGKTVMMFCLGVCLFWAVFKGQDVYEEYQREARLQVLLLQREVTESPSSFWKQLKDYNAAQEFPEQQDIMAFFQYQRDSQIQNPEFQRSEDVRVLELCGYSTALFQDAYLLTPEDSQGCLLDDDTAVALFGSTEVVGKEIRYQEETYIIRGILHKEIPLFVYEASVDEQEQMEYDSVAFVLHSNENKENTIQHMQSTYNLQGRTCPLAVLHLAERFVNWKLS